MLTFPNGGALPGEDFELLKNHRKTNKKERNKQKTVENWTLFRECSRGKLCDENISNMHPGSSLSGANLGRKLLRVWNLPLTISAEPKCCHLEVGSGMSALHECVDPRDPSVKCNREEKMLKLFWPFTAWEEWGD